MHRQGAISCIVLFVSYFSGVISHSSNQNEIPKSNNDLLELYLQPEDVMNGDYDKHVIRNPWADNDLTQSEENDIDGHLCVRECDGTQRTCYYKFKLGYWSAMGYACGNCSCTSYGGCNNADECYNNHCVTADTVHRNIITVNKRLPGTPVYVCKGDRVIVDVTNNLEDKGATFHWHGLYQKTSQWMDGVSMVSQCPIPPSTTFRYDFIANEPGTQFWHDHSGPIKQDGVQGPLIVRQQRNEDPSSSLYDHDLPSHVMFLSDWKHYISDDEFPDMKTFSNGKKIQAVLINGKGLPFKNPGQTNYKQYSTTPMATFEVEQGNRYRFRAIGALCMMCAMELSIQNHNITVIASDGNPLSPVPSSSIVITSGERYDIVVDATEEIDSYWIYLKGVKPCQQTMQVAVLKYRGGPRVPTNWVAPLSNMRTVNHPDFKLGAPNNYLLSQLNSSVPTPHLINNPPTSTRHTLIATTSIYTQQDFIEGKVPMYLRPSPKQPPYKFGINDITSTMPSSPLFVQYQDVPKEQFCSEECVNGTSSTPCPPCVHLIKVPLYSTVDLIIADTNPFLGIGLIHPFHLHGHKFFVLEQGTLSDNVTVSTIRGS